MFLNRPRFEGGERRFGDRDGYRGGPRGPGGDFGGDKGGAPADYRPQFGVILLQSHYFSFLKWKSVFLNFATYVWVLLVWVELWFGSLASFVWSMALLMAKLFVGPRLRCSLLAVGTRNLCFR